MDQFKEQVDEFIQRNPPDFPEFDCTNDEHKYRNIVYVCLKPECTLGNRLACPACLLQTHATHLNHLIEVKEIYLQTKGNVFTSNYPKDPVASEFRHYLKTQKEQLHKDHIDLIMDKFKQTILDTIERVREELKAKVSVYDENFNDKISEMQSLLHEAYSLEDVRRALDQYHQKNINLDETNEEIHKFANSEDRLQQQKVVQKKMTSFKSDLDTVFFQNIFDYCTNVSVDYVEKLKHSIDQLKNKKQLEEDVFRKEEMPRWLVELLVSKNESVLLKEQDFTMISTWLGQKNAKYRLLFRGSRDGMNGKQFHQKCDGKSNTIIVCKSKNHDKVFGAYSVPKWSNPDKGLYQADGSAFLFSITHQTKHAVYQNAQNAQYSKENYGPTFGGGHDLFIAANFTSCNSNLGYTFQPLVGAYQSNEARNHLAGAFTFDLKDIEVFQVDF